MSRNRNRRPPARLPDGHLVLTNANTRTLAGMLIRELTKVAGDPKAVETVLNHWLETQDVTRLSLICMSTVQQLFAEYLTKPEPPNERTAP